MHRDWLLAIVSMVVGLILWFAGYQFEIGALLPIALFLGTILPASLTAIDMARRLLPATSSTFLRIGILLLDVAVLIAIGVLESMEASESFQFLGSTVIAIWGTTLLGLGLAVAHVIFAFMMASNYARVSSGKSKALGAMLVGLGSIGMVIPLQFIDLTNGWPLAALPAMVVAIMGQRRIDQE